MLEYETMYAQQGFKRICGVDEAGRGPLAGPVCAAAVIFPEGLVVEGIDDSKKLSEKKREKLFDIIYSCLGICIPQDKGWSPNRGGDKGETVLAPGP